MCSVLAKITAIDVINSVVAGAALLLSLALAIPRVWRFRHAVRIAAHSEPTAAADGTEREFPRWHVTLLNTRDRPVPIERLTFWLGEEAGWLSTDPLGSVTFPVVLYDHVPVTLLYDLDTMTPSGTAGCRPLAIVATESGPPVARRHRSWVPPRPRLWRVRRVPRRMVVGRTYVFKAPDRPA